MKSPKELDIALCNYFKLVDLGYNTLKTYKSGLKSRILELSNGSVDISNPKQFPNYHEFQQETGLLKKKEHNPEKAKQQSYGIKRKPMERENDFNRVSWML